MDRHMKKLIIIALSLLIAIPCYASQITTNYKLIIPGEGDRDTIEILSNDILSIDQVLGILSADATGYVSSVTEGVASPLVFSGTTAVKITILSADITQAGTIDATQYTKINILSSDVNTNTDNIGIISSDMVASDMILILSSDTGVNASNITTNTTGISIISSDIGGSDMIRILSSDIGILDNKTTIISSDIGASDMIRIISSDLATNITNIATNVTNISIISSDIGASDKIRIISSDVGVLQNTQTIISSDVGDIKIKTTIISSDTGSWGIGTGQPKIQFTILDPENIPAHSRGDKMCPVWTNDTGKTFTVTKIRASSDEDNYSFHLGISSSLTDHSIANQTTMDVVLCDVDGTNVYTDVIETGFDDATVALSQDVLFQHFSGTAGNVKVFLYGGF